MVATSTNTATTDNQEVRCYQLQPRRAAACVDECQGVFGMQLLSNVDDAVKEALALKASTAR
jgi:hypothetical protein